MHGQILESVNLPHLSKVHDASFVVLIELGVQLALKHVEAVVVLQVLCLRVTEHNDATWQAGISAMHLLLTAYISA